MPPSQAVPANGTTIFQIMDIELFIYLAAFIPEANTDCDKCGMSVPVKEVVVKSKQIFCSEKCADIACAILLKNMSLPPGLNIDGWEL